MLLKKLFISFFFLSVIFIFNLTYAEHHGSVKKITPSWMVVDAGNKLDADGFMKFMTDPFTFNGQEYSLKDVKELFAARESQEWKPWAILPIKISNTDPVSGIIVYSTAEVVGKSGDTWNAEVSETYYFDLNGKINEVSQYSRSMPGTEPGSE